MPDTFVPLLQRAITNIHRFVSGLTVPTKSKEPLHGERGVLPMPGVG